MEDIKQRSVPLDACTILWKAVSHNNDGGGSLARIQSRKCSKVVASCRRGYKKTKYYILDTVCTYNIH
jgi:hypothetical protein